MPTFVNNGTFLRGTTRYCPFLLLLIYGVLNQPWESRGWPGGVCSPQKPFWLVFHIFVGISCFPNWIWEGSGQRGALLITARILGRNPEIKLTDHSLEQWIYWCVCSTELMRIYGNFWRFIPARTTRTVQANVPCKSFLSKNLWDCVCNSLELLCSKTRTKLQLK